MEIGPDGTLKVEIDTALAKEVHPDQDQQYQVTAEVVDELRRTIVGTGSVLVARRPFKVFAWLDRGYYQTGQVIRAQFKAQTLDQKPVAGTGTLKLLSVSYDKDGKPVEKVVQQWKLDTDAQGEAQQQIKAAAPANTGCRTPSSTRKSTRSKAPTYSRSWAARSTGPSSASTMSN